ncbi:MAG: proton-conducting transporter membrane subunit [Peptostreptococcaceae bacterium]|jgi:multicomponent Na+:H+ antiporter subunit D|nr:proton-conducting transporter membrane subunit [Peptostreptococcaceae bacterium]
MDFIIVLPVLIPIIAFMIMGLNKKLDDNNSFKLTSFVVFLNLIIYILILRFSNVREFTIFEVSDFFKILIKLDYLGLLFSFLASILWIFTTFYSKEYMDHEKNQKRFYTFFIGTLGVTLGIAFSGNLFTLYIFYELLTLATFPLVIHSESKEAFKSGRKYILYSFFGATLVLLGMIFLYKISPDFTFIAKGSIYKDADANLIKMAFMCMFLGFGVKAALVPFHSWLPSAMVAPTPVSSLLHAVAVVKSGIFAIVRITYYIFGKEALLKADVVIYASIFIGITILMGSLLALSHDNLKKRLAYSTISQLGYIMLGIMMLNENALLGGLLHLINHALIKIVLFFCAGAIYIKAHEKEISNIKGIGKQMPITMWCFAISSISLIGIPPSNGFVSKWYLALGGLNANKIMFPVILLLSAFLTAAYLLPIVITAFFAKGEIRSEVTDPSKYMIVPIVCITSLVVFIGLFPNLIIDFIRNITNTVL